MSSASSNSIPWEPPSPEELQMMLPQYEISAIIGRGGMGAVYRGRQAKLDRDVAIKLLPESLGEEDDGMNFTARFEQEAKAMAKLDHPAIISVHDFGETSEGQLYFVMEFIEGMDIHQYLKHHGGKLNQEDALAIIAHVLDALDYAHSHGIVHRDIKPANILLNNEGKVKVADFGLAKKIIAGEDDGPALTMSNMAVGTPDFVAPEALDGDAVPDQRADLYAIGVMLYQMLTGKLPRGQFKLPSELVPTLDPRLDEIVELSLQNDPNDRYASASAVRSALDPIFTTPITKAEGIEKSAVSSRYTPQSPPKSKMPLMVGGGIVALVVIGLLAFLLNGGDEPELDAPVVAVSSEPLEKVEVAEKGKAKSKEGPKTADVSEAVSKGSKRESPEPQPEEQKPKANSEPVAESKELEKPEPQIAKAEAAPPKIEAVPMVTEPEAAAKEDASVNPLTKIPGVESRLTAYLSARRSQVSTLAASYLRGLNSRLNQAADAADLRLAKAFRDEKEAVAALQKSLVGTPSDLISSVENATTLSALAADAPEGVHTLRKTWTRERAKISDDLDRKLQLSLKALGDELTRARDFDNAEVVMNFQKSLAEGTRDVEDIGEEGEKQVSMATEDRREEHSKSSLKLIEEHPVQGRLRTIGTFERGKPMDLSAAEGITDFIEVYCTSKFFIGLRAGGEVVSNYGRIQNAESERFQRILVPRDPFIPYGLVGLREGGKVEILSPLKQNNKPLPDIGGPVLDLIMVDQLSLALLEGGSIQWWGEFYDSVAEEDRGRFPPDEARRGVKAIEVLVEKDEVLWSAVLTDAGKIICWNTDGLVDLPREAEKDVSEIAFKKTSLYFLTKKGDVYGLNSDMRDATRRHRGIQQLSLSSTSWNGLFGQEEDGSWKRMTSESSPDAPIIEEGLSRLSGQGRRQFTVSFRPGVEGFIWIEPVDAAGGIEETTSAVSSTLGTSDLTRASKVNQFMNTLGMRFVPVPIVKGPTDGETVYFSIWETRVEDYEAFIDANPGREWPEPSFDQKDDQPAVMVNTEDALAFCEWLTEKDRKSGKLPPNHLYRLPSDHEWSCAVGIGDKENPEEPMKRKRGKAAGGKYWGEEWPPPRDFGNYSGEEMTQRNVRVEGYKDDFEIPAPVDEFEPNDFGLYQMDGNVHELVMKRDELAGEQGARGGSWMSILPQALEKSFRVFYPKGERHEVFGFRVVIAAE